MRAEKIKPLLQKVYSLARGQGVGQVDAIGGSHNDPAIAGGMTMRTELPEPPIEVLAEKQGEVEAPPAEEPVKTRISKKRKRRHK